MPLKQSNHIGVYISAIDQSAEKVIVKSLKHSIDIAKILEAIADLENWAKALQPMRESEIVDHVTKELQVSIYLMSKGLYRQSCSSLRLCLELMLESCLVFRKQTRI